MTFDGMQMFSSGPPEATTGCVCNKLCDLVPIPLTEGAAVAQDLIPRQRINPVNLPRRSVTSPL